MPTRNFLPSKSGRDNHWWDIFPIASIRSNHNELNSYWGRAANQNEFGHQKECVICENEFCIWTGCHIQLIEHLKELKDVFAETYKDLKGIPLKIVRRKIELDTTIPHVHQAR
jgi:hypothetical protein